MFHHINSFGGNNSQKPGKKTQVFNNYRQNINNFGNNNRQNENNESNNNMKAQYANKGKRGDKNNLNPETEIKINRKRNILTESINMNIFPNDDNNINDVLNNNNINNNININNIRKTISYKNNNNNINNNINNLYRNRNLSNFINKDSNVICNEFENKNNIIIDNKNNINNNINNEVLNFPINKKRKSNNHENKINLNINLDNNRQKNNPIQINYNKNNNIIIINNSQNNNNNNEIININENRNNINNINNSQNKDSNNDNDNNNIIINKKNQENKRRDNLSKTVLAFNDDSNDLNKVQENKNNQKSKKEKLKKKKQDEKSKAEIKDILKCYICMDQIRKPRLCKYCKRPACESCLKNWLREKHSCGFCRKKINYDDTIEIPIINDIADFFIKAINKEDDKKLNNKDDLNNNNIFDSFNQTMPSSKLKDDDECSKHKRKYEYYCFQCKEKYCDKCLSIFSESAKIHENHMIVPLEQLDENKNSNEAITEYNKLKQTNKKLEDLINLCNQKLNELQIEKNNIINQIENIESGKNVALNSLLSQLKNKYNLFKSKKDEFNNSIETTPIAIKNIIKLNDYGQSKQIYEHLSNLNKLASEEDDIRNLPADFISIESFVSDNLEIIIPNNIDNRLNINQPIINEQLDNLIPNVNINVSFEYCSYDVCFKINLNNNIDSQIDLSKILCFIIFKKKNYGIEFLIIKNQIKKNNEIELYSNISTSVFNSFTNDNNKIMCKFYFMVYK